MNRTRLIAGADRDLRPERGGGLLIVGLGGVVYAKRSPRGVVVAAESATQDERLHGLPTVLLTCESLNHGIREQLSNGFDGHFSPLLVGAANDDVAVPTLVEHFPALIEEKFAVFRVGEIPLIIVHPRDIDIEQKCEVVSAGIRYFDDPFGVPAEKRFAPEYGEHRACVTEEDAIGLSSHRVFEGWLRSGDMLDVTFIAHATFGVEHGSGMLPRVDRLEFRREDPAKCALSSRLGAYHANASYVVWSHAFGNSIPSRHGVIANSRSREWSHFPLDVDRHERRPEFVSETLPVVL